MQVRTHTRCSFTSSPFVSLVKIPFLLSHPTSLRGNKWCQRAVSLAKARPETLVSFPAEEGPPLQTDLSYYSYEYDPDPYASEADVFEAVAELTTASTLKEVDKVGEVVTTVEW